MGNFIRNAVIGIAIFIVLMIVLGVLAQQGAPRNVGPLNSAHWHVDFLVVVNGQAIDFSPSKYMVRSPFVHVEGDNIGGVGKVIHVHATGVPIGMFFESLNMRLDSECFRLDDGRTFCNEGTKRLRFYVNGQLNEEYGEYVMENGDRILLSYGDYSETELQGQLGDVSDLAKRM